MSLRSAFIKAGIIAMLITFIQPSTECEVKKIPHYASQKYNNKDLYKKAVWQSLLGYSS